MPKNGRRIYYRAEIQPLLKIKDNYPKYVLSLDENSTDNIDGIKQMHIADFLLLENF